jgi:hypothetical protein
VELLDLATSGVAAALGGPVGAAIRLVPALFSGIGKMLTAKADRAHELAMRKLDAEIAQKIGEQKMREVDAVGAWEVQNKTLDVYKEAMAQQARPSGVAWVDGMNQSVRPVTTYYFLALYAITKFTGFFYAWLHEGAKLPEAMSILWSPADTAMLFGILGFWFVDRQLGKTQVPAGWTSSR